MKVFTGLSPLISPNTLPIPLTEKMSSSFRQFNSDSKMILKNLLGIQPERPFRHNKNCPICAALLQNNIIQPWHISAWWQMSPPAFHWRFWFRDYRSLEKRDVMSDGIDCSIGICMLSCYFVNIFISVSFERALFHFPAWWRRHFLMENQAC